MKKIAAKDLLPGMMADLDNSGWLWAEILDAKVRTERNGRQFVWVRYQDGQTSFNNIDQKVEVA